MGFQLPLALAAVMLADPAPSRLWIAAADLARAAHLSRSRFFAFFQERMGLAPMAYVKEVRLAEARKWLIASDAKLPEIAEATGFANPFHLGREFKSTFGLPPGEFRERHRRLQV